jgi:hypothetical protein
MKEKLLPKAKQRKAISRKKQIILKRLREEIWTTLDIIALWINRHVETARSTMKQYERDGLVQMVEIPTGAGKAKINCWGLTQHGYAMSFTSDEEYSDGRIIAKSKIAPSTMNHRIDIQRLRVMMEKQGYTDWVSDFSFKAKKDQASIKKLGDKWPDAIAQHPDGYLVAFEVERTVKSKKRYGEILVSHLKARKAGQYDKIYYLCPDENITRRVKNIFKTINQVKVDGQLRQISDEHLKPFRFGTYS